MKTKIQGLLDCENVNKEKKLVLVKIIEEPINYETQLQFGSLLDSNRRSNVQQEDKDKLNPKFNSANFSGPEQLRDLTGECFEYFKKKYFFKFFVKFIN